MPKNNSRRYEDYLEAILVLFQRKGYARTKDISRELNVAPPTVTEMLKKLDSEDLVTYERYGGITLTDAGSKLARIVKKRHETIKRFLELILVQEDTADRDACLLEHDLSPESLEQLNYFITFLHDQHDYEGWQKNFKGYCRKKQ